MYKFIIKCKQATYLGLNIIHFNIITAIKHYFVFWQNTGGCGIAIIFSLDNSGRDNIVFGWDENGNPLNTCENIRSISDIIRFDICELYLSRSCAYRSISAFSVSVACLLTPFSEIIPSLKQIFWEITQANAFPYSGKNKDIFVSTFVFLSWAFSLTAWSSIMYFIIRNLALKK